MAIETDETVKGRRDFLTKCGKYAVATPPAVSLMLAASHSDPAFAGSGFHGDNGYGNGGHDGVPGESDHQDRTR